MMACELQREASEKIKPHGKAVVSPHQGKMGSAAEVSISEKPFPVDYKKNGNMPKGESFKKTALDGRIGERG